MILKGFQGAKIFLQTQDNRSISQGVTDENGHIFIYGSQAGDTVEATSTDDSMEGSIIIGNLIDLSITLEASASP